MLKRMKSYKKAVYVITFKSGCIENASLIFQTRSLTLLCMYFEMADRSEKEGITGLFQLAENCEQK